MGWHELSNTAGIHDYYPEEDEEAAQGIGYVASIVWNEDVRKWSIYNTANIQDFPDTLKTLDEAKAWVVAMWRMR